MSIEQNICESIDIIVQKRLNDAGFDKTIKATILSCEDASIGKYKVKYQDSIFFAYAGSNIAFEKGTEVFILIPENDMSKDKTIIGADQSRIGTQYSQNIANSNIDCKFNCFYDTNEYSLCSYQTDSKMIYINNNSDVTKTLFQYCVNKMDNILFTADFKTSLPLEQQYGGGRYGLKVGLEYKDKNGKLLIEEVLFDINSFVGQIYKLTKYTSQFSKQIDLHKKDYENISYIAFFCENFPNQNASINTPDIFVKNIKIFGQIELTEEELNDCAVKVDIINGPFLNESAVDTTLQADFYIKGSLANANDIDFYWFKEDLNIVDESSDGYCLYGGTGWKCLNEYAGEWVPSDNKLDIPSDEANPATVRYKCVVVFMNKTYSDEITFNTIYGDVEKVAYPKLVSDNGTIFYLGLGSFSLSCQVWREGEVLPADNYSYSWGVEKNGNYITLPNTASIISNIKANELEEYNTYKCQVTEKTTGEIIGIATLTLENRNELEGDYRLEIINGNQTFKYNENGIAPTSDLMDEPMKIKPLSFIIYDNQDRAIEITDIKDLNTIQWLFPISNTMLTTSLVSDGQYNSDFKVYKNYETFNYDIKLSYLSKASNNNIQLLIDFYGKILTASTNFTFLKEGQPGTNGTNFYCRLVPNYTGTFEHYPTRRCFSDGKSILNYTVPSGGSWFNLELWESGNLIDASNYTSSYKFLRNQYSNYQNAKGVYTDLDWCNYTVALDGSTIGFEKGVSTETNYPANILQATVTYKTDDNNVDTYYATQPIHTTFSNTTDDYYAQLKPNTGYDYVMYSPEGKNPVYLNREFEVEVRKRFVSGVQEDVFTYEWSVLGRIGASNSSIGYNVANLRISPNRNKCKVTPKSSYDGYSVNNAILCKVFLNGTQVCSLHMPINMYLNRYSNSAINGWNGNSVQVDNAGGFILAPQVGAGVKNDDNTFTGMVMGKVQTYGVGSDIGLVAYNKGVRSIFLDAETGNATFGSVGNGQILITPTSGQIRSGNYSTGNKTGMLIDLNDPYIKFGSGNFSVGADGKLIANDVKITGGQITIGSTTITSEEVRLLKGAIGVDSKGNDVVLADRIVASEADIKTLNTNLTTTNKLIVNNQASINSLNAKTAEIEGTLEVHGNLIANKASIEDLNATTVTITGRLDAAEANIDNLESDNIVFSNSISSLDNKITFANGKISAIELEINSIQAGNITIGNNTSGTIGGWNITADSIHGADDSGAQVYLRPSGVTAHVTIPNMGGAKQWESVSWDRILSLVVYGK